MLSESIFKGEKSKMMIEDQVRVNDGSNYD